MSTPSNAVDRVSIHPDTGVGTVSLTVSDLARSRDFYSRALGLIPAERDDGAVQMSTAGGDPLIELHPDPSAPALDRRTTGLYHLAVLVPSRRDLAFALARLAEARWPLDGASDHLVSEALYLSDPDGNGIEIYRDRPRSDWRRRGDELEMATVPLDINGVLKELAGVAELQPEAPAATRMGHVHLQVADIQVAEDFYSGVLGFDVIVRGYPGALFVSAGGYHHHLGLNTWHSRGASPPPPGAIGLRSFEVELPDATERERVVARLDASGMPVQATPADGGVLIRDPFGNGIVLGVRR